MAQPAAIVKTQLFISRSPKDMALTDAVAACGTAFHQALALLYAPHKCFLALVNDNGRFEDSTGEIDASVVFEARIFNAAAELRWLNKEDGEGAAVVLVEGS